MGTCTCPPLGLGFIHRPGAVRRSRARRSCRGLRRPAPPGRGEGVRGGCAPAPGTGDPLPAAPPGPALPSPPARGAASLGCPGTGGFLRGGGTARAAGGSPRRPQAGLGRSACCRLSSPSSRARPSRLVSAAGCCCCLRSLLRRSYSGPNLGELTGAPGLKRLSWCAVPLHPLSPPGARARAAPRGPAERQVLQRRPYFILLIVCSAGKGTNRD